MREFLTRRIGPAPLWLWFVVFVFGVAIFLRWRSSKSPASTDKNSNATNAPNLTTSPSTLLPWSQQIFVNVQKPAVPGTPNTSTTPPPVGQGTTYTRGPRPPADGTIHLPDPRTRLPGTTWPGDTITPISSPSMPPPPRQTSMTYEVRPGDTLRGIAETFGYRNPDGSLAYRILYDFNASVIEAVARQHGMTGSDTGHWIFPGTSLMLPI